MPLDPHTTLSAYYNRSLRLHDDTVSIGMTYVIRGSKPPKRQSDADLMKSIQQLSVPPPPRQ